MLRGGAIAPNRSAVATSYVRFASASSPTMVVFLLAIFLLPVALWPASYGRFFRIPPLPPLWWSDNLLLPFLLLALAARSLGWIAPALNRSTWRWLLLPMGMLGFWQTISLVWNGRDGFMRSYSFVQSLLMCAAVAVAVALTSGLSRVARFRALRNASLMIMAIVLIYAMLSVAVPGWRPSAGSVDREAQGLGFIRIMGPLGTPVTLNFMLTPLLGVCVGMLFLPGTIKIFWMLAGLFIMACIVGTGSRGGLVSFAAFAVLLMLALRLRAFLVLIPVALIIGAIVLMVGVPERFRSLEDRARFETYSTALRASVSGPLTPVFGVGHGALYSKHHDDTVRGQLGRDHWYLLDDVTPYGYTLRNGHSALLRSLTETGLIGLLLCGAPLALILSRLLLFGAGQSRDPTLLFGRSILAGCAAVIPCMALDEFFVSAFWIVVIWTMFAVMGIETVEEVASGRVH